MLKSALTDDSTHQRNNTKVNIELILRENINQKVEGLWFPPIFMTMITFALVMLVLHIVINIFKKCCVRKANLKRCKKAKDPNKIKHIRKSLAEILDELEANEKDAGENEDNYGRISFKCNYDFEREEFTIFIISAEDLLSPRGSTAVNSYAVVYLLPLNKPKFETWIKKNSIKPTWEDSFTFSKIRYIVLLEQTLVIEVRHDVKFGIDPIIGILFTPMRTMDIKAETQLWYPMISPDIDKNSERVGEINISIRYIPTASRLIVSIVEVINLIRMDTRGLADPYVKLVLYHGKNILSKSKTSIKKQTLNPYFDESYEMLLPNKLVENVELNITVFDKDKFRKELIGFVKIGCSCQDTGRMHWVEMLDYPRKTVTCWHQLKPKQKLK